MASKNKNFECPFKSNGDRRCPAKIRDLDWDCPLVFRDEHCAIYAIATSLYRFQLDGIKHKE
jgi:hypothetical protein